ncbi:AraC family transcriptional regulator ligand-binding domain-containing protein [Nocardia sp. NEAU-G5]|uniref:AraC family transcriptional regulator ligand-binding domain-containing protein n=1 Tax=Nocardia albiluteola TaxID=2842303 RepID=A0ABS6AQJ3_9NOCA|nr:AraC family transcriptional regulator ligand-binding domain-containing protein [Nocardia albiluteola]MBU3060279.1 AraC family transcriptional regulator ligand-binding domain-containing protein [Nocardia albiluteola]
MSNRESGESFEATDNALLPISILRHAVSAGLPPDRIERESGLPSWTAAGGEEYRIPSTQYLRVWEVVEHCLGDPNIAVRIAEQYVIGQVGLYDYLFKTAPTVGAGLALCGPYVGAISTNFRFEQGPETERDVSFEVTMINGDGRGRDLAMQWALAAIFARGRLVAERPVSPARVEFRQAAPRDHRGLVSVFGTSDVEFGAPADRITLRRADLDVRLRTADAGLAAVLQRYAATLPGPPPRATTWLDHLAAVISAALHDDSATIDGVATRMFMSRRTLQRKLAAHDTTWRAELELARRTRYENARADGVLTRSRQAALLGYKDVRSARRAVQRWGD